MNTRGLHILGAVAVGALLSATAIGGQTVITPPNNKYTTAEDVELGSRR